MRAILIDPFARTVTEIELAPGIKPIYDAIKADCFCTVNLDDGDAIYLDDDGLFREGQEFFSVGNYPHPLAGRGVVLGSNDEGESRAPVLGAAFLAKYVHWLTPLEAVQMNREAAAALHASAAIENASESEFFHVVSAPLLEIDGETGKARAG